MLLKALPTLLPYLGNESGKLAVLEMLMDILCVFEEEEIRKEGFRSVEKVVGAMELGKVEKVLVEGL